MSQYPSSKDDFTRVVDNFKETDRYRDPMLFAVGGEVRTNDGLQASTRFPVVNGPNQNTGSAAILMKVLDITPQGVQTIKLTGDKVEEILKYFYWTKGDGKEHRNLQALERAKKVLADNPDFPAVATFIFDDIIPQGIDDTTLKLYGLSHTHFEPNTLNLNGAFGKLPNVFWKGDTPIDLDEADNMTLDSAFGLGEFSDDMLDKFPLYTNRMGKLPGKNSIRILDPNKVRLGAYLGKGSTLMPGASYVNFNAGGKGNNMIEGRISSSAFVGQGTKIGGGASILGTLSGGNKDPIKIGNNCLLEANSGLGFSIGDYTIIRAGLYVTATDPVKVNIDGHEKSGQIIKAVELSGISGVTFRRNGSDIEVVITPRNKLFEENFKSGKDIDGSSLAENPKLEY